MISNGCRECSELTSGDLVFFSSEDAAWCLASVRLRVVCQVCVACSIVWALLLEVSPCQCVLFCIQKKEAWLATVLSEECGLPKER
jgi:hypothetical protein